MVTQQSNQESQLASNVRPRGRGPAKPFPLVKFEDIIIIAKTIFEDGLDDRLRRLALFERLDRTATSSTSRNMITSSSRYGLTSGSHSAEYLTLTEDGKIIASQSSSLSTIPEKVFHCAIRRFDIFNQVYEKLKGNRLPAQDVLQDQFGQLGLSARDCDVASEIFLANSRYVGIIREVGGSDHIIPIEQLVEEISAKDMTIVDVLPEDSTNNLADEQQQSVAVSKLAPSVDVASEPSLHIDIQIHIDSAATSEQIDQIFASMARHLYGRKE